MTLTELAEKSGIAKSAMSRYLNGTREFPLNKANQVADALHISPEEIIGVGSKSKKDETIDDFVNGLRSYQGKPVSKEQREFIRKSVKEFLDMTTKDNSSNK